MADIFDKLIPFAFIGLATITTMLITHSIIFSVWALFASAFLVCISKAGWCKK